jgi:CRISPR-associated protein Csb1
VKLPRLIGSTIRGYQIQKLTRSAQFFSAVEKEEIQELGSQDFLSNVGLNDAPAGRTDGGVIARGGVKREAQLNLIALRALTGQDAEATLKLQRYILGLALVSLLAAPDRFLREGCLLTAKKGSKPEMAVVARDGVRNPLEADEHKALEFARAAAAAFVPGSAWTATFDKDAVKKASDKKKDEKAKKGK